ncbi:MAG: hypothetical protein LBT01_00340 [Spirochaetaceae bacterium]|jgi:hypothetical protein|nr:hypothetical protein [Spirochaetaceae bacterium]
MKIIVLKGESNHGKTATLHLIYEKIILVNGGMGKCFEHVGNLKQRDFSDILSYKDKKTAKRKKIAFFTMGDDKKPLEDAIKEYTAQQCDILVCACNNDNFGIFGKMGPGTYKVVEKTIRSDFMPAFETNLYDCYRILEIITHT